ncbi:MAG: glycosyltransferase family 2 protein [Verrucomicrobiae bacterium]|nr:glycosyltransferase family 2 protein [Verrucomicrobiae bacterium]
MHRKSNPHITVCVCTYKRPSLLGDLISNLVIQETSSRFTYDIVVVDNDAGQSARETVANLCDSHAVQMRYAVEPEQNIARARNLAMSLCSGDFVAFIDDDEIPNSTWLFTLFEGLDTQGADGALGPVVPRYTADTPSWVVAGEFYSRQTHSDGHVVSWQEGRTGNLLFKREILATMREPFRVEFITGEDQDFFRRAISLNYSFVWVAGAVVHEHVPESRCKRRFMLRRAILRGRISTKHPNFGLTKILKSAVAVPGYLCILPFMIVAPHHLFMRKVVSMFDHIGCLLATVGLGDEDTKYVTE